MDEANERSPWICHICSATGQGESTPCGICHRTTCLSHLAQSTRFNPESGLYEITPVCLHCAAAERLG